MVNFGSPFQELFGRWYRRVVPDFREAASCRTYEQALSMVEAGLGVAIVPMLSTQINGRLAFDVDLFSIPIEPRKVWAMLPSQYRYMQPYARVIDALIKVSKRHVDRVPLAPPLLPMARTGSAVEVDFLPA
jgi:DNA-binding transcriptional LysR family regulator